MSIPMMKIMMPVERKGYEIIILHPFLLFGVILMGAGYEVLLKGPSLYAFKALVGRFCPYWSTFGDAADNGRWNSYCNWELQEFRYDSRSAEFCRGFSSGLLVKQFRSDLSLFDIEGKEVLKNDEGPFNLAMAPLKVNGDKKLFGTFLPLGDVNSSNVEGRSMLARDLQSLVIYEQEGKFAGVRRPNSKLAIDIDGTKIVIVDAIGSTGLDLKLTFNLMHTIQFVIVSIL
ncbi:cytochrome c biogenesis protein CCS1 [Citrus sinensis]|uniref:Cytochrome c biogenesis protein CCS1 n=1 Tax=Citrus sinensis TaxID=2711 RepID=A0ACB8IFV6_CITSI|nr:cytochrome c biogenesis protein CCS1 [Citrus sinensis]